MPALFHCKAGGTTIPARRDPYRGLCLRLDQALQLRSCTLFRLADRRNAWDNAGRRRAVEVLGCWRVRLMAYDPKAHHRRSIRWFRHDYAQGGTYFVTLCVQNHRCLLGTIRDGKMRMHDAGRMVQATWDEFPAHYPGVKVDAFVVMPNHVHGIVVLDAVGAGPRARPLLEQNGCVDVSSQPQEAQPRGGCPYRAAGGPACRGATAGRRAGPRTRPLRGQGHRADG